MDKVFTKKKIDEIVTALEIGGRFSAVAGKKYIYVCKNNGQFHMGEKEGRPGYAHFIGRFTPREIIIAFLNGLE